jgi:hypothetical protein
VGEELKMLEDWLSNPSTEEDCQRDAVVKSEEEFHPEEQLDEAGLVPAQGEELTEGELSGEMVEQKLSSMAVEFGPAVEWKAVPQEIETTWEIRLIFPLICVKEWKPWRKG